MKSSINVVVIVGSATTPDQILRSALGDEPLEDALVNASGGKQVELQIVSWLPSALITPCIAVGQGDRRKPATDRLLSTRPFRNLYKILQSFAAGRLLNSLGPLDQSRVFWRAVQMNEQAVSVLRSADVLLAVDLPAVKTAWEMRRKNAGAEAYFGIGSTLKVFASRSAR